MARRDSKHQSTFDRAKTAKPTRSRVGAKIETDYASVQDGLAAAEAAAARGDRDAALSLLGRLRQAFPSEPEPFFRASRLLAEAGRPAEADRVLQDGQPRFENKFGFVLGRAWLAHHRRDFAPAGELWTELREAFPDHPAGYSGGAITMREAGRLDEADALAAAGTQRFPEDFGLAYECAQLAQARGGYEIAGTIWDGLIERFPERPEPYLGAARGLRDSGRIDEADNRLREAASRFPEHEHTALEAAWIAERRSDWNEAARRWQAVRERFPGHEAGYLMGAAALRAVGRLDQAEGVLAAAIERFPAQPRAIIDHAAIAAQRNDMAEAARRWERVRAGFPDLPDGYLHGAAALSALRREDEADALLAAAVERFPAVARVRVEQAWNAFRRESWAEAEAQFAALRADCPDEPAGYLGGAAVLGLTARIGAAEQLLEDAMRHLPNVPQLALDHARLAVSTLKPRRDWVEGLRRLERMHARFPDFEPGFVAAISFAREGNLLERAEAIAGTAVERFPASPALVAEHARVALDRRDWSEAAVRFRRLLQSFPNEAAGYVGMAEALSRLGDFDGADRVLETAMQRFPGEAAPFSEYARVAIRKNDWASALDRALAAQRRFPNAAELTHQLFEARLRLAETDPAALGSDERSGAGAGPALEPHELVMQFESLGGSGHGCEFGVVQRRFGAEPLGLLRWADLGPDSETLTEGLLNEFAGVGEPEQTELTAVGERRAEYGTRDRRYYMAMRAFVYEDEVPRDKMFAQVCRRLQYLRRKLLEDLREGRKIFVYKNMWRNLTDAELDRLHAAMRRYGDNTLLYVRWEDATHPNGTVELRRPGLMVGYIDHFDFSPQNESLGPATRSWFALCREAYRIRADAGDALRAAE